MASLSPTGHKRYNHQYLLTMLIGAAHQVVGLGDCLYYSCTFRHGMVEVPGCHGRARCRGARRKRLKPGMRLAGLSTRPLDDLDPGISFVDRGAR